MLKLWTIAILLWLPGCTSSLQHFGQVSTMCKDESGHEPYAAGHMFGLVGAVAMTTQPGWLAWDQRRRDCINVAMQR